MANVKITPSNGKVQLSEHFTLEELIHSDTAQARGLNNTPNPLQVQSLFKVAALLEQIRNLLGGVPITVNSGYRSPAVNAAVGGVPTSDHQQGCAVDFVCPAYGSPLQICRTLAASSIKFRQLIQENTWVHISLPQGAGKDGEILTAIFGANGKVTGYRTGLPA